jgi:two-component system cell cycle sensor histidine kinase/response regulator CckA
MPAIGNCSDSLRLRQAIDAAGEAIFTTDRDGFFTFVNTNFERLYGYSFDEVVGAVTPRILKGGCSEDDYRRFWQALARGETVRQDFVNRTKAGDQVDVNAVVSPMRDSEGTIVGFVAVQRDVTSERETEAALRESERRCHALADAAQDAIFVIGLDQHVQFLNRVASRMLGGVPDDLVGRTVSDCVPTETATAIAADIRAIAEGGQPIYREQLLTFNTGDRWQSTWLVPLRGDDGDVTAMMGISRDITDKRRLAALLDRQNGLLGAVIEHSPIGIAVLSGPSHVFDVVNPALHNLLTTPNAVGRRFDEIWPGDRALMDRTFQRMRDTNMSQERLDVPLYAPVQDARCQGAMSVTINIVPLALPGESETSVLLLVTDTTARKHLEEQFAQAQKMEAVGRLAGGIAHDFNNLLTSILGYSELLLENFDQDDARRRDLEDIRRAGLSAASLTRQLLVFSRKQVAVPTILNLNAVVSDFQRILLRTIGEDVAITITLDPEPGWIKTDAGQLEQLLMNLCVNARDAMPQGGTVTIGTRRIVLTQRELCARRWVPPGRYVALTIADTGAGMSEEVQSHLFEPFFTTKEFGKGTGLGLSTVYGVVKQSGGYIGVKSKPGGGTTFTIHFPETAPLSVSPIPSDRPSSCTRGGETVLVVEDCEGVRELVVRTLEKCGYRVMDAGTPRDALRLARRSAGPIDLLLTDVVMPGADGLALFTHIARRHAETRVLYMSGHTEDVISHHGLLDRSVDFMQKPFDAEMVARRVREALRPLSVARCRAD